MCFVLVLKQPIKKLHTLSFLTGRFWSTIMKIIRNSHMSKIQIQYVLGGFHGGGGGEGAKGVCFCVFFCVFFWKSILNNIIALRIIPKSKVKNKTYKIECTVHTWLQTCIFIFILQSVHLLYKYTTRINVCFIRSLRINFWSLRINF